MREVVIISGKGGTGKTSLAAAFAHLAERKVICDLDVDAPDLHILLDPKPMRTEEFFSGHEAVINPDACTGCGICASMCRYEAISPTRAADKDVYHVAPMRCEGCSVCVAFCPEQAIAFPSRHCGTWHHSATRFGDMIHAQLFPGNENSGLLVSRLKKEARALAQTQGADLILCDGAPGIGCPVIASLSQTDLAVVVTEPTPSGVHDLERVTGLCDHFRTKVAVIVNKYDLNPEHTARINALCGQKGYALIAHLPHDEQVTQAMVRRQAVTEGPDSELTWRVRQAWHALIQCLG
ncbi:ATP-binding protein [Desulfovibrionales bacterium]